VKLAIIGANGFIGSRMVEWFHLGAKAQVVAIVRGVSSLARLARYPLDWRLANACDLKPLADALSGTDVAVHSIVGDPRVIESAAAALLPAAAQAGVRRVVYLSSASVHGQSPAVGTSEESALSDRQMIEYNNAKVRAERTLFRDSGRYPVELIVLRPSIVFGPRDRWVSGLASELEQRTAWLINQGDGICNTIYVDNLVHAVALALEAPSSAAGQAYLVGDAETISWRQLYQQTARRLGFQYESVHQIPAPSFPARSVMDRLEGLRTSPTAQRLIAKAPRRWKRMVKGALKETRPPVPHDPWLLPVTPQPRPTQEMVLLQQCSYRLPDQKAQRLLNYKPLLTFEEGLDRTIAWQKWAKS
jgi:nucleoside-diphosphate-sugar epimerase